MRRALDPSEIKSVKQFSSRETLSFLAVFRAPKPSNE